MKKLFTLLILVLLISCKDEKPQAILTSPTPKIIQEFGFKLNNFKVINDTIKPGENFSEILDRNHEYFSSEKMILNSNKHFNQL